MGTQGSGRKRAPLKDRFSAEDEALSSIAREAEARLAAKRAARAEARDIRMRELERQQKERSYLSSSGSNRKWGQIHQWMADSDKARGSSSGGSVTSRHRRGLDDDVMSACSYRSSVYSDLLGHRRSSSSASRKDLLTGLYHDQRNYSSLTKTKATPPTSTSTSTYRPRVGPQHLDICMVWRSSSDDDTVSSVSQERFGRGRRDSVSSDFSDISESAADYFSRTSRRGSIVSDVDDVVIPELDAPSSRCATPSLSAATLASLGGSSSRRGSADAGGAYDPDSSLSELRDIYELKDQIQDVEGRYMQGLKELKESLAEVEEKYKKAMVSNAQLDNDKGNLIYQVDTLKDVIEEMEEHTAETRRELEDKTKELERQKHTCTVLQHKQDELKEGIRQRDELIEESQRTQTKLDGCSREVFDLQETINWKDKKIGALERQKEYFDCIRSERDELRDELAAMKQTEKHGLVIIPDGTPNGDVNHEPLTSGITVVSQEAAQVLESAGEGPLDVRLRKLAEEKDELLAQIRKLKAQLEEERQKHSKTETFTDGERAENGTELHAIEMQRDANRQISEYKFKISKAEQEMGTMEQNVSEERGLWGVACGAWPVGRGLWGGVVRVGARVSGLLSSPLQINRLEGQVSRYKSSADNSEKVEDELKVEKRKLQRELRTALDKIEEMEMTNNHLVKRLEKMKANRNALLSQQ
ncbi:Leucine-rich repeat flightless-interacting protein 2 [Liparis tanakae]|uniref:Leucine-rich repeat flightless-interacting protein 2 n=1 Tax=Liparis tanakae TaxID=230148 RepID=A0A4Z2FZW7_9TELE|nr:Leucine-rich repeat flightless-interacting protein 2 [Liparis tanakae]